MESVKERFCAETIGAIESGAVRGKAELESFKLRLAENMRLGRMPSNPEILLAAAEPSERLVALLSVKPLRTLSGVAPVAVMTAPARCPHGTCIYCPGGLGSPFGDVPQSYTGHEPATMRGIGNDYDSYAQTMNRLGQYYSTGHNPEKLELIIMGGTFPSTSYDYQRAFVSGAFMAVNDFSEKYFRGGVFDAGRFNSEVGGKNLSFKKAVVPAASQRSGPLEGEHARNEESRVRIVTMCIETKPDWSKESHINTMLELGATRVELGAQSLYDEVLRFTNRGHTVKDTAEATRLLKDSALKVTYHMMPGQPLSSREKDVGMFRRLFEDEDFRPDGLKIYPCMVMPGTALGRLYELGKFSPLSTEEAAEIISEAKRFFPEWTRVHRVQRDIPVKLSLGGIDKNNLRQLVELRCAEKGVRCRCVRCRESGINSRQLEVDYPNVMLAEKTYVASGGKEVFISFEDRTNDLLVGFCRLRQPCAPFRPEFTGSTACIREVHVFGQQVGIGKKSGESQQHRGYGQGLVRRAEEIAAERFGADKVLVISGVGAREYYARKLGYAREGVYMSKRL